MVSKLYMSRRLTMLFIKPLRNTTLFRWWARMYIILPRQRKPGWQSKRPTWLEQASCKLFAHARHRSWWILLVHLSAPILQRMRVTARFCRLLHLEHTLVCFTVTQRACTVFRVLFASLNSWSWTETSLDGSSFGCYFSYSYSNSFDSLSYAVHRWWWHGDYALLLVQPDVSITRCNCIISFLGISNELKKKPRRIIIKMS